MQDWAERAVSAARLLGEPPLTAAAVAVLALGDAMTGSTEQAQADRSEAAALVESLSDDELALRLDAAAWLAGAELYMDRYAEADRHAERALAVGRATGQGELFLVLFQILGRAWYVRGRLAEAAELLDGAIDAARLLGNTHALAWNLFNRSVVALAVGDVERALAQASDGDRATGELRRAVAEFNECGALRYRNEAERELRKLGHSIHRRTRPGKTNGIGVASLTERELEIARLVVDRKTNSEIAAALFLSPKTIETHMRNIFRKLNVLSRVEVARAVERAEDNERALSQ